MTKTWSQAGRFALAGVVGLAADVVVLYLALALGLGWYLGRVVSFLAAVWVTWRINRRYTFEGAASGSAWRQWWRYLLAMLGGGGVNYAVYGATVIALRDLPLQPLLPLIAVGAGSLAGMAVNFLSAKFLVFRR